MHVKGPTGTQAASDIEHREIKLAASVLEKRIEYSSVSVAFFVDTRGIVLESAVLEQK